MKQPHKEVLTAHKVKLLKQAADHAAETGKNEVPLSLFNTNVTDYTNFQKLRYHGLIHRYTVNGQVKRGSWLITRNGYRFLRGDIELPANVTVQDNHIIERSSRLVSRKDLARDLEIAATTFEYIAFQSYPEQLRPVAAVASKQIGLAL